MSKKSDVAGFNNSLTVIVNPLYENSLFTFSPLFSTSNTLEYPSIFLMTSVDPGFFNLCCFLSHTWRVLKQINAGALGNGEEYTAKRS